MRAVVQNRYGDPAHLRVGQVDRPVPQDDEVLVRVAAASVHPDVWHVVTGRPRVLRIMGSGLRRPAQRVPGTDLAGVVEAVGSRVTRFAVGDRVFGETLRGLQWHNGGAFAEYAVAPAHGLASLPEHVAFEQAATVPTAGLIALANLPERGRSLSGKRVLINGAAGGVGSIALQVARAYGATVTGVDATSRLGLLRAMGADRVIDHTRKDFTDTRERYDVVLDVPGNYSFARCRRVLAPHGRYVLIGHDAYGAVGRSWVGSVPRMLGLMARAPFSPHLVLDASLPDKAESMADLAGLLATGRIQPVVGRRYPLERAGEAIEALASGAVIGRIVLVPGLGATAC